MRITSENGKLNVPADPEIVYIEGDGVGQEITDKMRHVLDAAIAKAYGGKRRIEWKEALAGGFRFLFLFVAIGSVDVATFPLLVLQVEEQPSAHGNEGYKGAHDDKYSVVCHN